MGGGVASATRYLRGLLSPGPRAARKQNLSALRQATGELPAGPTRREPARATVLLDREREVEGGCTAGRCGHSITCRR